MLFCFFSALSACSSGTELWTLIGIPNFNIKSNFFFVFFPSLIYHRVIQRMRWHEKQSPFFLSPIISAASESQRYFRFLHTMCCAKGTFYIALYCWRSYSSVGASHDMPIRWMKRKETVSVQLRSQGNHGLRHVRSVRPEQCYQKDRLRRACSVLCSKMILGSN